MRLPGFTKRSLFAFLLFCFPAILQAGDVSILPAGGVNVGGGGDAVLCKSQNGAKFVGYFPLDYVIIQMDPKAARSIAPIEDAQHMTRIQTTLDTLSPLLGRSFREFMDLYLNTDFNKTIVWKASKYGLSELEDEEMIEILPRNCYELNQQNRPHIIQAVIREQRRNLTIFNYDPQIMKELARYGAPYRSYILVHEWLRKFTSSARVIRDVNYFLHSRALSEATSATIERTLESIGLNLSGQKGVSARSIKISPWGNNGDLFIQDPAPYFPGKSYELHVLNETNAMIDIAEGGTNKLVGRIQKGNSTNLPILRVNVPARLCASNGRHARCFNLIAE